MDCKRIRMFLTVLCLCTVYLVSAENTNVTSKVTTMNVMIFRDVDSGRVVNVAEHCNQNCSLIKCCPKGQILDRLNSTYICVNSTNFTTYGLDYSEVDFYYSNIEQNRIKSSKKMNNFTQVYSENFFTLNTVYDVSSVYGPPACEVNILENGHLGVSCFNMADLDFFELTAPFCVEYLIQRQHNETVLNRHKVVILTIVSTDESGETTESLKNTVTAYALLVSCFFLLLVLVVYSLLPQLRNLAGMMLMAYVSTLIIAIILRAVMVIGTDNGRQYSREACLYIGFTGYYAIIACYTWMNVMSFDIWWTMRGFRKSRQIHRRGILVKFGWYSLYGWGAPLAPVLFSIIVESLDLTHLPRFIKPHFSELSACFMHQESYRFYMNGPILVATCMNIALFLMTAYNIWRIKSGVTKHSVGESRRNPRNKGDEIRFGIYMKLSLVMGVFWILEVVSSFYKRESWLWYIPDIFNSLIGLFIFIIFVCKRHIIGLLFQKFSIGEEIVQKWQTTESTRTAHG